DADKCYGELAGVSMIQYDDDTFSMVAFDPMDYVISTAANTQNEDGFNRGTSVGTFLTGNGAPSTFKASRLYQHPGIKSCHHKNSDKYAIAFNRTDASQPYSTTVCTL
ncbi:unnamed protein product, partial [Didymodactylos carnosus]